MTFPIFEHLHDYLAVKKTLNGVSIGWHCHLTELTEIAVQTIVSLGAQLHMSECNASTTDPNSVERMRQIGANIYLGPDSATQVLSKKPLVISDTGFHLTGEYITSKNNWLYAACEITTSGISKLRQMELTIPVINLNDTTLKSTIENYHGVGDGLIEVLKQTGRNLSKCRVAVIGYGQVGAGCARYLKEADCLVSVVEQDPVRSLKAHYDGFQIHLLPEAMSQSEILVTASGQKNLLSTMEWNIASDGLLVVNVGHFANELDILSLEKIAKRKKYSPILDEFVIDSESSAYKSSPKRIYIATGGHPANVVMLTGSPEPTLIHLATEVLALAYLIELYQKGLKLAPGEIALPRQIEELASLLALKALNLSHNSATRSTQTC